MPQTAGAAQTAAGPYDVAAGRITQPMAGDRMHLAVRLGALEDPASDDGHFVTYAVGKDRPGGRRLDAVVRVMQGYRSQGEPGKEIARFVHGDLQPGAAQVRQAIAPEQAAAIDDYTDLHIVADFERTAA